MTAFRNNKRFVLLTVLIAIAATVAGAELMLRGGQWYLRRSDVMEPGLLLYDPHLGWALAPAKRIRHRHFDFDVTYTTDRLGFRFDPHLDPGSRAPLCAVVGDSFTFGIGVENDETFVSRLNQQAGGRMLFRNFGVPGYSTDQELLLIQERVAHFNPRRIVLVVCLINDIFDNTLPYPLQADHAKPLFAIEHGRLVLENIPVASIPKPPDRQATTLSAMVTGGSGAGTSNGLGPLRHLHLAQWASNVLTAAPRGAVGSFDPRFRPALDLFAALVAELERWCQTRRIRLTIVLLPGRQAVRRPASLSGAYQSYLAGRAAGIVRTSRSKIDLVDLSFSSPHLRAGGYHPHEGHLNRDGHRMLAATLFEHLHRTSPESHQAK